VSRDQFFNVLKNTPMTDKEWDTYVKDARKYRNLLSYLAFYNLRDVEVMVTPILKLMGLFRNLGIDMLHYLSGSSCANALKHKMMYDTMDLNADYNLDEPEFKPTLKWAERRALGYCEQDKNKSRDTTGNMSAEDILAYFTREKECVMCHGKFTKSSPPTLDRKDNEKGHSPDNVQPMCLTCNCYKSDKDEELVRVKIQTRKFALKMNLPMTITNEKTYHVLRDGITGGLANVGHRYNFAGETFINKFRIEVAHGEKRVI
jgi:hypothetical protein